MSKKYEQMPPIVTAEHIGRVFGSGIGPVVVVSGGGSYFGCSDCAMRGLFDCKAPDAECDIGKFHFELASEEQAVKATEKQELLSAIGKMQMELENMKIQVIRMGE